MKRIKLLKTRDGVPAGAVGVVYGEAKATGGLTLRFDREGHDPEVLINVPPEDVEALGPTFEAKVETRVAWWLKPYLWGVAAMAGLTGLEPDRDKVKAWAEKAFKHRVKIEDRKGD